MDSFLWKACYFWNWRAFRFRWGKRAAISKQKCLSQKRVRSYIVLDLINHSSEPWNFICFFGYWIINQMYLKVQKISFHNSYSRIYDFSLLFPQSYNAIAHIFNAIFFGNVGFSFQSYIGNFCMRQLLEGKKN